MCVQVIMLVFCVSDNHVSAYKYNAHVSVNCKRFYISVRSNHVSTQHVNFISSYHWVLCFNLLFKNKNKMSTFIDDRWSVLIIIIIVVEMWYKLLLHQRRGNLPWSIWQRSWPQMSTAWVRVSMWSCLKCISSSALPHHLWRLCSPFRPPCAQKWP